MPHSSNGEMSFDSFSLRQIIINGPDGRKLILQEATGEAVATWRDAMMKLANVVDGEVSSIDGLHATESLLVSLCLFETTPLTDPDGPITIRKDVNGDPFSVPQKTIQGWPNRIQKALFEKIKEISDLEDAETPEVLEERIAKDSKKLNKIKHKKESLKN